MKKLLTLAIFSTLSTSALAGIDPCGHWEERRVKVYGTKVITIGEKTVTRCTYIDSHKGEIDRYTRFYTEAHDGDVQCRSYTKDDDGRPVWLHTRDTDTVTITKRVTDYDNYWYEVKDVWVPVSYTHLTLPTTSRV